MKPALGLSESEGGLGGGPTTHRHPSTPYIHPQGQKKADGAGACQQTLRDGGVKPLRLVVSSGPQTSVHMPPRLQDDQVALCHAGNAKIHWVSGRFRVSRSGKDRPWRLG